ncbi:hypothetical protein JOC95_000251 [Bacillus tianshenii]|uniref:Uncharacterized protein n=1 Tax=Sutcliffiella tianshenii TaxID=1463404 RepID=A0ABS2NUT7_9BACI|nr:hypothetical protein [Bacillus tianshenii]MBM7618409.1 hypothetical protein [Bacillus tianshenii]
MEKFRIGPKSKAVINFICFALSLLLLIYNISIVGFFYLLVTYGEEKGMLIYSLISLTGIFLVVIPLVFRMAKQKFYHYTLIATHLLAALLPMLMQKMSGVFNGIL